MQQCTHFIRHVLAGGSTLYRKFLVCFQSSMLLAHHALSQSYTIVFQEVLLGSL